MPNEDTQQSTISEHQKDSEMFGESSQEADLKSISHTDSNKSQSRHEGAIIGGSIGFYFGWIIGLFGWLGIGTVFAFLIIIIACVFGGAIIGKNNNLRLPPIPEGGIKYLLLAISFTNVLVGLIFGSIYLRKPYSGSYQFAKLVFIVTGIGFAVFVFTLI